MKNKILCFLVLVLLVLLGKNAYGSLKSIHIEWGYTPPSAPAVIGYKLYQENVPACQVMLYTAANMDCFVALTKKVTTFTMTALFDDDTESPHSSPYAFTDPDFVEAVVVAGNTKFSFSWDSPVLANVKGYKVYMNNKALCENTNSTDRTLSCVADSVTGTVTFNMTEIYTDNTESNYSNSIIYNN